MYKKADKTQLLLLVNTGLSFNSTRKTKLLVIKESQSNFYLISLTKCRRYIQCLDIAEFSKDEKSIQNILLGNCVSLSSIMLMSICLFLVAVTELLHQEGKHKIKSVFRVSRLKWRETLFALNN